MRKYPWAIAGILVGIFTITAACNHSDNNSASSKHPIVKWFQGEPGATQNVNNAVDRLLASGWDQELLALSDQLMDDYAATISTLEYETYTEGRLLPLNHLPNKFHDLDGGVFGKPKLVLRLDKTDTPTALILSWGNMRHAIIIYSEPPSVGPTGFFIRQANERIYVIANER